MRISAGVMVWASAFVALYAGHALSCRALPVSGAAGLSHPVTVILAAIAIGHGAALVVMLLRWSRRLVSALPGEPQQTLTFRHTVEGLVLSLSLAALVFIALPILMATPCSA